MNNDKLSEKKEHGEKYKYIILLCLCMVAFISVFCQYQMQPMANQIKNAFGLTDSQYSALFTAPMTPAIFISLICGIIVDKFGGRWPMFISLVIGALGLWGRVFATSYGMLYVCVFAVGFTATFGNSSNARMFRGWFSPAGCSICIGIYMACSSLGGVLAITTTPLLPSLRSAYMLSALIITFVAVFWFFFFRNGHEMKAGQIEQPSDASKEGFLTKLKVVIGQRDVKLAGLADMLLYGGLQSLLAFMGIILMSKGMTESQTGTVSAFVSLGMLTGNLTIPRVVNRTGTLRKTLSCIGCIGSILMIAIAFLPVSPLLRAVMFGCGMCVGGIVPVLMSIPLRLHTIGAQRAGTAGGLIATFQLCGAVIIPTYIISKIAMGNYTIFVILCGSCSLLGALLIRILSGRVESADGTL